MRDFFVISGPGSSHEIPGFPEKVLGEMLGHKGDPLGQCRPGYPGGPCHLNPNSVKIVAATHLAGAYNLKKVLPCHVLQRRQPPQINPPAGTLE